MLTTTTCMVHYAIVSASANETYQIPFQYFADDNVHVVLANDDGHKELIYGTDYTVTPFNSTVSSRILTRLTTWPSGYTRLTLFRVTPIINSTNLINGDYMDADFLENLFDRMYAATQEMRDYQNRSVHVAKYDPDIPSTDGTVFDEEVFQFGNVKARKDSFLYFNANGVLSSYPISDYTTLIESITTLVAQANTHAQNAAQSAQAAAQSEQDAKASKDAAADDLSSIDAKTTNSIAALDERKNTNLAELNNLAYDISDSEQNARNYAENAYESLIRASEAERNAVDAEEIVTASREDVKKNADLAVQSKNIASSKSEEAKTARDTSVTKAQEAANSANVALTKANAADNSNKGVQTMLSQMQTLYAQMQTVAANASVPTIEIEGKLHTVSIIQHDGYLIAGITPV